MNLSVRLVSAVFIIALTFVTTTSGLPQDYSLDCLCPQTWGPVYGSDGNTYTNTCFFEFAKNDDNSLTILHTGICSN